MSNRPKEWTDHGIEGEPPKRLSSKLRMLSHEAGELEAELKEAVILLATAREYQFGPNFPQPLAQQIEAFIRKHKHG